MKIILVCFMHLDELPPMITALKILSKRYSILYIGVDDIKAEYRDAFGSNVRGINVLKIMQTERKGIIGKLGRFIYRIMYGLQLKKAGRIISDSYENGDLLWIHHEHTLMHLPHLSLPYLITMYELHPDLFKKCSKLKNRVKKAKMVVVPEYTRAAIVQACIGLSELPRIIPNKPYDYGEEEICILDNPMDDIVSSAHKENKKVILYSGIFLRERKLEPFIEAVGKLKENFVIVLVGRKSEYLEEILARYSYVKYLGFYNPPQHLAIIGKTDIGILTYVSDSGSINPVFCAPNKIWEYSKYGIPMICNDIPGLRFTVEYNKIGLCCDLNSIDSVCNALMRIYKEYDEFSQNASEYYKTVDIGKEIVRLVEDAWQNSL